MGKVSTNGTGSGGDERNIYIRRYKSTSNSSKASSNASLAKTMGESESSSRSKHTSDIIKPPNKERNNIKSKLRSPIKVRLSQSTNRVSRPHILNTHKEVKKASGVIQKQNLMTKMKQESETERKQKSSHIPTENKEPTEQVENTKQINESNYNIDQLVDQENGNANGLDKKELTEANFNHNESKNNGQTEENGQVPEINENEDFNLHLDVEENINCKEEILNLHPDLLETNKEDSVQKELQTLVKEVHEHLETGTDSYSVDVVESTTSEVSDTTESATPLEAKSEDIIQDENNDAISYDSSIMLKDVKIKLNDCLKDTKPEEDNADQGLSEYVHKETTFGQTLRTISGRNSIGRMRHITIRDRQPSPNSSLFVNTSNISLSEENINDYKILRRCNTVSELTSSNGTLFLDRKRKLITESISELKKPKIEESNLWNASFGFLKYPFSLRRPIQVSTPYKFQVEKHDLIASKESKTDDSGIIKKWCVIM
ncbi:PREDICTED: putative uncharacterized protein DDB_G0289963 [Ceratosolen solmsi marchali]|uniref:Uncharacterized protein n=1 Tax=Ceratosolen solmsi marchali TaxID=326594 RepID=A0AAJ6YTX9_9HYME|nr:PREDICTED: putative uncharacterized protein DDB_G0289963 [Ceratosolen solmsi marchali]